MPAIIEIRNLTKIYRAESVGSEAAPEVRALDGISLSIEKGDFVSIVGQSGSGKSTLMQILGLLDRKTGGDYLLDGEDISTFDDTTLAALRSHKIGFIFQFFNLLPRTTATDNVALPMLYAGDPDPTARAQNLLKMVGLDTRLYHKPHQLSGGQQQRVAIARALANDPALIFADEPTGNISSEQSEEILAMLEHMNKERGVTIVLVTHEPDVAERAGRIITLRDGRVYSDRRLRPLPTAVAGKAPLRVEVPPTPALRWRRLTENLRMARVALSLNKMRTALATLGIVIGISSVVAMVSVGRGAQNTIEQQLSSLGTNVLTVIPTHARSNPNMAWNLRYRRFKVEDYEALARLAVPGGSISQVGAMVNGQVQASYGAKNVSTRIVGATASYQQMQNATLTAGRFFTDGEDVGRQRLAILGQTAVRNLYGEDFNPIGSILKINRVEFRVIGVLTAKGSSGFQDADDQIIVPLHTTMFRVLGRTNLDNLNASVRTDDEIPEATAQIQTLLRQRRSIGPGEEDDFSVRSLNEIRDAVNKSTQAISSLLAAIASISLLVGGIGIMNVMLVSVKERTKEIGLRKALGARRRDVLVQFLVESVLICLLGGAIGLSLGYLISAGVSLGLGWPVAVPPTAAALAFFFSLFVGVVFGMWPAKQASNLSPIEALRYE